jgi:hypothetical protein
VKREDFNAYLKRLAVRKLGRGATATVFQHPTLSDVVVKVGLAKPDSQGYEWLQWCHKHSNAWAPRVYSIMELDTELPAGKKGRMFVAFMERLEKADSVVVRQFFADNATLFPKLERSFWGFNPGALKTIEDPELRAVLKAINQFEHCDFKLENVMMRGTQIVFSDPVY